VHESSVPELTPGTIVTTEIDLSCGRCWYCRTGNRHHCADKEVLGITIDGGFSEYISVPAELVHPLPTDVDVVSGTFTEPLASAIKTVSDSPAEEGEAVLIIGSGKIALLLAQVYDASGADVYIIGRNRWQLGLARQLGLLSAMDIIGDNWKKKLLDVTHGVGPRIVVEATGNTDGIRMAFDVVRNGGTVNLKSMHGLDYSFNPTLIVNKELTVRGAGRGPYPEALDMLQKGRIEVKRLVSKEFRLEDGAKAFEYANQPSVTKVVINI
jgi:threonine dehydrogenase-like Zn-dependent dehydrogenase